MSRIGLIRKKSRLRALFGIRARLVLLALILVGPLMVERIRALEDARAQQLSSTVRELSTMAQHAAAAQREIVSSAEAVLKSSAYIHVAASQFGDSCQILLSSLRVELPWIRTLSVASGDGAVRCSNHPNLVGANLADRPYFIKAVATRDFVLSDYLFSRANKQPTIVAAYPVGAIVEGNTDVIVAGMNLDWLSGIMSDLGGRSGVSAALVDSDGTVLASTPDQKSIVGKTLDARIIAAAREAGATDVAGFPVVVDGAARAVFAAPVGGTSARLVVTVDQSKVAGRINREIRSAYLQLGLVSLMVLLGALIAAERLIVQPIEMTTAMANQFGQGDWDARVDHKRLPAEFAPLARAFNAMAARLRERERGLVAINNRLTVMASIDPLSGLANRRGFQSRLDFEWLKAQQTGKELALLMIDVDHFKLYNDTYGHPEGDACLTRIGDALAAIAKQADGFAARYGGEEFCLLLPNAGAAEIAGIGEQVRSTIECLDMPHQSSIYSFVTVSVGVAHTAPDDTQEPRDLVEAADAALYAAKHGGRNAVVEHGLSRGANALAMAS